MRGLRHLLRDGRGASAAEFALVLPLLLLFLFGIIDVGRLLWMWNQAEKATQMGARFAVATDWVPGGIAGYSFVTSGGIAQGESIPASSFAGASCTSNGTTATCTCKGGSCPWLGTAQQAPFTRIVDRMRLFLPNITASNVRIDYDWSGLGYAGDPNGADVAPIVRVGLQNLSFQPITLFLFRTSIPLPSFSAALTMEDGQGSTAN